MDELTKGKEKGRVTLQEDGREITEEKEIANTFNNYFRDKINKLKDGIDEKMKKDPLENLTKKLKENKLNEIYVVVCGEIDHLKNSSLAK